MSTKRSDYGERMARVESKVDNVEKCISTIETKLDTVLKTKADKKEVTNLNKKFWSLAVSLIGLLLAIIGYLLTNDVSITECIA